MLWLRLFLVYVFSLYGVKVGVVFVSCCFWLGWVLEWRGCGFGCDVDGVWGFPALIHLEGEGTVYRLGTVGC